MGGEAMKGYSQWCDKHWEPFKNGSLARTHNGILSTILLITALFEDKTFVIYVGKKTELINTKMREISPLCCYLGDEKMAQILEDCKNENIKNDNYKPLSVTKLPKGNKK